MEEFRQFRDTKIRVSNSGTVLGAYGRPLKPSGDRKGYLRIQYYLNGKRYFKGIHQLVAEIFIGEYPPDKEINHKNGIKADNRIENLEYVTAKENATHAVKTGLRKAAVGERCHDAKLKESDVIEILQLHRMYGLRIRETAEEYGVNYTTIHTILKGSKWKYIQRP